MEQDQKLDPVFDSDRGHGVTSPESGAESGNVVGRPVDHGEHSIGFHDPTETAALDREAFSDEEALTEGGSFDGLGLPVADDSEAGETEAPR